MTDVDIDLKAVRFAFPTTEMQFDLNVKRSSLTIVTGPSGSGKSTLLNLIAGFEAPLSGAIWLLGQDMTALPPAKRPVSMLFQDHNLFNHLTVEANVSLGIKPGLRLTNGEKAQVQQALARVGLQGKSARRPTELSGGERQRVAFARTLVQDRPILLLDEPFASLGPALRQEMVELLSQLQREKQLTVLAVTHHPNEWNGKADGFLFVSDGHIVAQGSMEDLSLLHKNAAIASYLGAKT
ncbi:MAG: thiamine ABC transporter ATP-binding protein [Rhizobiaceae bacterium]